MTILKRLLRWVGIALGALAALAVLAYGVIYAKSERILGRKYEIFAASVSLPADAASIEEGRRLSIVLGCFGGCHGQQAEGSVMFNQPMIGRIVAPDLTASVRKYDDGQLVTLIRSGLRPDGVSTFVMPSESFVNLSDEDLGRIIAFLRSLPATRGLAPGNSVGPLGRIGIVSGEFKSTAQLLAVAKPAPEASSEEGKRGRYLAQTACGHCHGTSLRGSSNPDFTSPPLQIVAAYSPDAFAQLMRTGVAPGGRQLRTMSPWAKNHLSHLTDAEVAALYGYLHELPAAGGAQ